LSSKNSIELINGYLFVHGGIHPDLAHYNTNIEEINHIVRSNYHKAYYPKKEETLAQFLTDTRKGPSWYRGYFSGDLTQQEVEKGLDIFKANAVVVGHTLQYKVKKMFNAKVFCLDVNHPKDYRKSFPNKQSEGLLITNEGFFRAFHDGELLEL